MNLLRGVTRSEFLNRIDAGHFVCDMNVFILVCMACVVGRNCPGPIANWANLNYGLQNGFWPLFLSHNPELWSIATLRYAGPGSLAC
jgi:hypothetical protein